MQKWLRKRQIGLVQHFSEGKIRANRKKMKEMGFKLLTGQTFLMNQFPKKGFLFPVPFSL